MEFDVPFSQLSNQIPSVNKEWGNHWFVHEKNIERKLTNSLIQKVFYLKPKYPVFYPSIAENSIIHIANSMPMRDVEWQASEKSEFLKVIVV